VMEGSRMDRARWFDFAILSQRTDDFSTMKHPGSIDKIYYGLDVLSLWMLQDKSRSFGQVDVSEVVQKIWEDVVGGYKKYNGSVSSGIEVSKTGVVRRFFQVGDDVRFLRYLRGVAGGIKKDGYLCWIDRGKDEVILKFKSVRELKERPVKKTFEVEVDPKELDKAYSEGELDGNRLPILYYYVDARNSGVLASNPVWKCVKFDIGSGRYEVREERFLQVEKDVVKSFVDKEWDSRWGKRVVMKSGYEELLRVLGVMQELKLKRRIWIWTVGNSDIRVGDKIRLIMPLGHGGEVFHFVTGDWIVFSLTHCISAPDWRYFLKVGLIGEEFGKEGRLQ